MEEERFEAVSVLEEWLRREDEIRAHAATDEERDVRRHVLLRFDDTQMADAPGPSGIARKTTYSPTYDEPPIKAIKLVPYSDSEDEGGSPKKTIGTDDDPPQLMDYSAQPTTSNDKPSMTREWGLTDEQCISWEHELQQTLDTIPSSLESWFDNMLNDLPDELDEIGKDSAYSSCATSAHERTTQRMGLGAHKKTLRTRQMRCDYVRECSSVKIRSSTHHES